MADSGPGQSAAVEPDPDPRPRRSTAERLEATEARTEAAMGRVLGTVERRFHLEGHVRAARFVGPLVLLVAGAVLVSMLHVGRLGRLWAFIAAYFGPGGIEVGIPLGVWLGIHPITMIAIILYVDYIGGLFLVWNLDLLDRVPRVGPRLARLEARAAKGWAKRPRLEAWGLGGLAAYVAIPISLSGVIPGMILGRLLGFPPGLTWLAVSGGATVRVVAYVGIATGIHGLLSGWF